MVNQLNLQVLGNFKLKSVGNKHFVLSLELCSEESVIVVLLLHDTSKMMVGEVSILEVKTIMPSYLINKISHCISTSHISVVSDGVKSGKYVEIIVESARESSINRIWLESTLSFQISGDRDTDLVVVESLEDQ